MCFPRFMFLFFFSKPIVEGHQDMCLMTPREANPQPSFRPFVPNPRAKKHEVLSELRRSRLPQPSQNNGRKQLTFLKVAFFSILFNLRSFQKPDPFPWVSGGFLERFGSLQTNGEGSTRTLPFPSPALGFLGMFSAIPTACASDAPAGC